MDFLIDIDTQILLWINGFNHEVVDPVMMALTWRYTWIPLYLVLAYTFVRNFGWKQGLIAIAAAAVAVGLSDFVCASLIRPFFQRLRPSNLENEISALVHVVDGYRSGSYGFPSCHAANSFALVTYSCLAIRQYRFLGFMLAWGVIQCYSRVYLGVHYPGDILVGAMIGSLVAWCAYLLIHRYAGIEPCGHKAKTIPVIATGIALFVVAVLYRVIFP